MFERLREDYQTHGRRLSNRCFWAMCHYRFGRWANGLRFAPARWLLTKGYGVVGLYLPIITGVSIDRRMPVGRRFHLIHPGMIALHPQASFGDDCGVMHNVTVGTNMSSGAPHIGNDVFIGCGATILGEITIGDGVRIASNSLVISDVPAGAMAMGVPAKIYPGRGHGKFADDAKAAMSAKLNAPPPQAQVPMASTIVPPSTRATFRGVSNAGDRSVS
jgi:serine O-acetyltransferase